ncbi:MAG: GerMN domain-containing protein [Vicinamibacterales bacterium]
MTPKRAVATAGLTVVAALLAWLLFVGLPRWYGTPEADAATGANQTAAPNGDGRKITARLFYVSADGTRLTGIEREVPYAERTADQARHILEAQIARAPGAQVSAVPSGTSLRALYVTDQGTAFVDLSREVASAHPGGSLNELLTIYTIVQALTSNIPAVTSVQLLVDGKEVETLAGHVDIRGPLPRADAWVSER